MAEQITTEELSMLEKFRQKVIEFRDAFLRLMSLESSVQGVPELQGEFAELYADGERIRSTVDWITKQVDAVVDYTGGLFNGLGGNRLGAFWLIPVAAIAGALAYMGSWVADVYLFERRVTEYNRLAPTLGHEQALDVVGGIQDEPGWLQSIGGIVKPISYGVGLYALYKLVTSMQGGGK